MNRQSNLWDEMRRCESIHFGFESFWKVGQQGDTTTEEYAANHFFANIHTTILFEPNETCRSSSIVRLVKSVYHDCLVYKFLNTGVIQSPGFGVEKTFSHLETSQFQRNVARNQSIQLNFENY